MYYIYLFINKYICSRVSLHYTVYIKYIFMNITVKSIGLPFPIPMVRFTMNAVLTTLLQC